MKNFILGFLVGTVIGVWFIIVISDIKKIRYVDGIKQGQIEVLSGKIKYKKITKHYKKSTWVKIKKEK